MAEHGPSVLRVCRALVGRVDADDAWSETFLAALRAYPDLRPGSNVRGWLVTIAHRKAIDQIRRSQRSPRPAHPVPEAGVSPESPAADAELLAAVESLPPKQRGAVVCRYLGDLSYPDIALLLDTSEDAARRSAADGIAKLRRTYAKEITR